MRSLQELAQLNDEEAGNLLGFPSQLSQFRSVIERARKLPPVDQRSIEQKLDEMLSPRIHPESLMWRVEEAERARKTGKEVADDDSPSSVL